MLSPKSQLSLRNAREYFREHLCVGDYYAEGQRVTGDWFGEGAAKLGLKGKVTETEFLRLCDGLHPKTGERLTQRMNSIRRSAEGGRVANRRVFYDFAISPPKSVSIVALLQDDRILAMHDRAVQHAMVELEKFAESRVRKSGQCTERVTGNVVAAAFRHDTSRELDPHLHTHCVVMNATFDPTENRWKALEVQGMYRAQKFAENVYYHELSKGLLKLGYEIEDNARDFEIKGVPASLIARFSKRHQQIDAEAEKTLQRVGGNTNAVRRQIARDSRRRKMKDSTADRLRPSWMKQMDAKERSFLAELRAQRSPVTRVDDVESILAWADAHLFERRSVVHDHELLSAALAHGRGQSFELAALRSALEERGYIREAGLRKLTSREVLRCELGIVVAAHDGRDRHAPLNRDFQPSDALSAEQKSAVAQILGSRDFITLFRGGAGTGKSFALKEVTRGLAAAEKPVVVLAPQRQQVTDLKGDGLAADTLAAFLQTKQLPKGAVVVVDEAGQIGGRDLGELIRVVQASAGRLILSGDTRQHGAVAASDALRAIEQHAGLKPAEVCEIRRQDPSHGKSAGERAFIRGYRAAVKAAAQGAVAESYERLDRLGCIREIIEDDRRRELANEYVAAFSRKEKTLVVAQTRAEARAVNEEIRSQLCASGAVGSGTVLDVCQPIDLGEAQKRDPRFYESGQRACFLKAYGRFAKGDLCEIEGTTARGIVLIKNGRRSTLSYRYADRIVVATTALLPIAQGDRLQLKFNGRSQEGLALNNGELVTVQRVRKDGALVVESDDGGRKTLAPTQRLFVRGYAVTSYGSQGKTVDTVLFADAAHRTATNTKQWYVTISRGRRKVVVFTSDKEALRDHVGQLGERELALSLKSPEPLGMKQDSQNWRRTLEAVERYRRHQAVLARMKRNDRGQKIAG